MDLSSKNQICAWQSVELRGQRINLGCFSAFPSVQSFVMLAQQAGFERELINPFSWSLFINYSIKLTSTQIGRLPSSLPSHRSSFSRHFHTHLLQASGVGVLNETLRKTSVLSSEGVSHNLVLKQQTGKLWSTVTARAFRFWRISRIVHMSLRK